MSAVRLRGRLLMSSIFDHYRHPCMMLIVFFFFPFVLSFIGDVAWPLSVHVHIHVQVCVCVCEAEGEGGKKGWVGGVVS